MTYNSLDATIFKSVYLDLKENSIVTENLRTAGNAGNTEGGILAHRSTKIGNEMNAIHSPQKITFSQFTDIVPEWDE